jgi:hypothetical protein
MRWLCNNEMLVYNDLEAVVCVYVCVCVRACVHAFVCFEGYYASVCAEELRETT